jgi:hypothetical protein
VAEVPSRLRPERVVFIVECWAKLVKATRRHIGQFLAAFTPHEYANYLKT